MRINILAVLILILGFQASVFGAENRIALVIGNTDYQFVESLRNPRNDAQAVAKALEKLGFSVTLKLDQGIKGMETTIREFGKRLRSGGQIAFFYYAGHGIQRHGENYLVPIDAPALDSFQTVKNSFPSLSMVQNAMKGSNPSIIILDACRNDPFSTTKGLKVQKIQKKEKPKDKHHENGLVRPTLTNPDSTLIAFATQPGNVASDVLEGKNHSPYAYYLLKAFKKTGLSLLDFFNEVGRSVKKNTNGKQEPWVSASPIPRICLVGACMNHVPVPGGDIVLPEWKSQFNLKGCTKDYTNVTCEVEVVNQGRHTKTLAFRVSRSPVLVDTDGNRHIARNVEINDKLAYGRYYLKQRIRRGETAKLMIYFNKIDRYLDYIPLLEIGVKSGKKRNKLQTIRFKEIDLM